MSRLIKIANWSGEKRGNVVFVHGLGGHPYDTWRRRADDGTFWPLWLAHDIKGLGGFFPRVTPPPTKQSGAPPPPPRATPPRPRGCFYKQGVPKKPPAP